MNIDREHWTGKAEEEAAYLSNAHQRLTHAEKSYSDATKDLTSKPHSENKFAKVNLGTRFSSALPEWVKKNTNPTEQGIKENDGMYKKVFETVTIYWYEQCTIK